MSGNIYLDFELPLDPATTDAAGVERLLRDKIRLWNQNINFNPRYKLLVSEAEQCLAFADGLSDLKSQAEKAHRVKWRELQDKIKVLNRIGINESVTDKLIKQFAAFFTEETVIKELEKHSLLPDAVSPDFMVPQKPESLQCLKNIPFTDMLLIADDLRFVGGEKCKTLYALLQMPQTAPLNKLYNAAMEETDRIYKVPKSSPEADPLNRLSGRFLLYFKDEIYRRSYDVALYRLPFDILAADVFDLYAEGFRSNQKTDRTIWMESVQKTVNLGFSYEEAEYLVYEFYCLARKCLPPNLTQGIMPVELPEIIPKSGIVPPKSGVLPPQAAVSDASKPEEFPQPKISLRTILLTVSALVVIAGIVLSFNTYRTGQWKKQEKELQQELTDTEIKLTVSERALLAAKEAAEQEKKKRLAAEEREKQFAALAALLETRDADERERRYTGSSLVFTIKEKDWRFRWCPAGTFIMGSPENEKGSTGDDSEMPHRVLLTKGFYILETEITQEHWAAVMDNNPAQFKGSNKLPVENVSWNDCRMFVNKLNEIIASELVRTNTAGQAPPLLKSFTAALPTESQWEYACRAGSTTAFCSGDDENRLKEYAWYGNRNGKTCEVGTKKPNAWGLYDMHGNVSEWCSDLFGSYPDGTVSGPSEPAVINGSNRVQRGGAWNDGAEYCRSAYRIAGMPEITNNRVGFRIVLVLE
ncbi:hypothetical protein FACS18942_00950 [Planctomycetales bacterium]|nr:hypothetical protein FACS18942_00950 [Planctomycetales bacterium]